MGNIEKIGIIGLGTIGLKLCEYFAEKKYEITAYNFRNVETKRKKFSDNIDKKVKYEKISYEEVDRLKTLVDFTDKLSELSQMDLIIEATVEDYDVKKNTYNSLSDYYNGILASTSSSLNILHLAGYYKADKFFGLHFFNPPTKMKLIELSFTDSFSLADKNHIYKFLNTLDDKKIIELPPIQGYIVNRLLFIYINAAITYIETTKFEPQTIDEALKLGTNSPMGPLELSDYIGNDITLSILNTFYSELHDVSYKPPSILLDMVSKNYLGRKTNKGFYSYEKQTGK